MSSNTIGQYGVLDLKLDTGAYLDTVPDLFWVQTLPSELEPMSDGERVFFTRHPARGDLRTVSGRVLVTNTTLDTIGEEFLGNTIHAVLLSDRDTR